MVQKSTPPPQFAVILAAFMWFMTTRPVYAYLDPGTGSYLFQIGLASLFGILFAIKTFWLQIKTFLANLFGKKTATTPTSQSEEKDNG